MTTNSSLNLLKKYKVFASKSFGQNFLIDDNIISKILNLANIQDKEVIEIGPGLGSLTFPLLQKVSSLEAFEVDKKIFDILRIEIKDKKFILKNEDFIKTSFNWKNQKTIVANIPYNITSDILFKIFYNYQKFDEAIIMMQKEVAKRLTSQVGESDYGKLTVSAQHFCSYISKEILVKSTCFVPTPKVDSTVVKFVFKKKININENKEFLKFVKQSFAQRRKTLFNNFKNFLTSEKVNEIFQCFSIDSKIRPQNISYELYLKIFHFLKS